MTARLLTILFCILYQLAYASEKVSISPAPSWLYKTNVDVNRMPQQRAISGGYYLELKDNQVNIALQTVYTHFIRNIVNESGVQNASEVSVNFVPDYQHVVFHTITIWREEKIVSKLSKDQIRIAHEESDASSYQYNGIKRAYVLLKDIRKDDRIDVSYSIVGFNPVFGGKFEKDFYFAKSTEVCNYFETIIAPRDKNYYFKYFNNASAPVETELGNDRIYQWSNPALKLLDGANNTPSWYWDYPYAMMTEYASWKQVAEWGLQTFKNYDYSLPVGLKEKIAQWSKEADGDQDAFIEKAMRFVQNQIRYLGLEMGENTHKPHSPEEVYRNRFGDCKDKALLLSFILKQQNIPAYVVLVNTSLRSKLTDCVASATQFDHAVVAIERSNDLYIYIDPTFTNQMGSIANIYIPAYEFGLILRKETNGLSKITPGGITSTYIRENFRISAKGKGDSRLEVESEYIGGSADDMRSNFSDNSLHDLEEGYVKYYSKSYDGIRQQNEFIIKDDSLINKITVNKSYIIPDMWTTKDGIDKFSVFSLPVFNSLPNPASLTKDVPLALEYPLNIQHTINLEMPSNWSLAEKSFQISTDAYDFRFTPILKGSKIELNYILNIKKDHIAINELAAYKENYKKIVELLEFEFSWNSNISGTKDIPGSGAFNIWAVIWAIVLSGIFFLFFKKLNKRSVDTSDYDSFEAPRLKGWVVVLGTTIAIGLLLKIIAFLKTQYFSQLIWTNLGTGGGKPLQLILLLELGLALFSIAASIALLYWFIQKRDIFPRMFIGFAISMVVSGFVLAISYNMVQYENLTKEAITQIYRSGVYAAIWVSYVLKSQQVQDTFIYPYNKTNYKIADEYEASETRLEQEQEL